MMHCRSRIKANRAGTKSCQSFIVVEKNTKKASLPIKAFNSPSSSVKDFGFICLLAITIIGFANLTSTIVYVYGLTTKSSEI